MLAGRPGPVHVDVPLNVFVEATEAEIPEPSDWRLGTASRGQGDPADAWGLGPGAFLSAFPGRAERRRIGARHERGLQSARLRDVENPAV